MRICLFVCSAAIFVHVCLLVYASVCLRFYTVYCPSLYSTTNPTPLPPTPLYSGKDEKMLLDKGHTVTDVAMKAAATGEYTICDLIEAFL